MTVPQGRTAGGIAYRRSGTEGDPVLLIHGSFADGSTFDRLVSLLAPSLRLIVPDRRGYGHSDPVEPPIRSALAGDVADLTELLETLDDYPVHLLGHSYGGTVSFALAEARPDLVRSVTVHEPPYLPRDDPDPVVRSIVKAVRAEFHAIRATIEAGHPDDGVRAFYERFPVRDVPWEELTESSRSALFRAAPAWAREFSDEAAWSLPPGRLADVPGPVVVTAGSRSPPLLVEAARRAATALDHATFQELPGVGHSPQVDDPAFYAGWLLDRLLARPGTSLG